METYTAVRDFVCNPHYLEQRKASLSTLDFNTIDPPIVEIIRDFTRLPYCFTLQSCYGHFLYDTQRDPKNTGPMPRSGNIGHVDYRIAYIALCLENSVLGKELFRELERIPMIDPAYIQFGCAEWFWKRQVNSFVLQVQPEGHRTEDRFPVSYQEALHIEGIRNQFFHRLKECIQRMPETWDG